MNSDDSIPKTVGEMRKRVIEHHQDSLEMAGSIQNDTYAAMLQMVQESQDKSFDVLRTELIDSLLQLNPDVPGDPDVLKLCWGTLRGYKIEQASRKDARDDL